MYAYVYTYIMSLFEQTLINNYVFSETGDQMSGGAPITELVASHENSGLKGGGGVGAMKTNNPLATKKHLSIPVGLVMVSHREYLSDVQRFENSTIQEPLFDRLIANIEDDVDTPSKTHSKTPSKTHSKSLKLRQEKSKKQSKRNR